MRSTSWRRLWLLASLPRPLPLCQRPTGERRGFGGKLAFMPCRRCVHCTSTLSLAISSRTASKQQPISDPSSPTALSHSKMRGGEFDESRPVSAPRNARTADRASLLGRVSSASRLTLQIAPRLASSDRLSRSGIKAGAGARAGDAVESDGVLGTSFAMSTISLRCVIVRLPCVQGQQSPALRTESPDGTDQHSRSMAMSLVTKLCRREMCGDSTLLRPTRRRIFRISELAHSANAKCLLAESVILGFTRCGTYLREPMNAGPMSGICPDLQFKSAFAWHLSPDGIDAFPQ